MNNKKFLGEAKEIFGRYDKEKTVFFTADGQAFFQEHFADAHSQTLREKDIVEISRDQAEAFDPEAEETDEPTGDDVIKHILTQQDLDANPELIEQGLKVGDEVDFKPVAGEGSNGDNDTDLNALSYADLKAKHFELLGKNPAPMKAEALLQVVKEAVAAQSAN